MQHLKKSTVIDILLFISQNLLGILTHDLDWILGSLIYFRRKIWIMTLLP